MVCGILMVLFSISVQRLFQMAGTDFNACIPAFHQSWCRFREKKVLNHTFPVSNCFPPNLPLTIEFCAKYSVTSCLTLLMMSDFSRVSRNSQQDATL